MYRVISLQGADGSWELTNELAAAMGFALPKLEEGLQGATGSASDARRAWATALALAWLRQLAADHESHWRLLGAKAEQYLASVTAAARGGVAWIDAAASFLRGH